MPPRLPISSGAVPPVRGRSGGLRRPGRRSSGGPSTASLVVGLTLSACSSAATPPDRSPQGTVAVPQGVAGCEGFAADSDATGAADGVSALRLPCPVGGQEVARDDLGSRPVLVNLWSSWCAPSREEMPLLQVSYERHGERVGFLGVNAEDAPAAAAALLADRRATYAHLVDGDRELLDGSPLRDCPSHSPSRGTAGVLERQIGQICAERLERLVAALLEDPGAAPAAS